MQIKGNAIVFHRFIQYGGRLHVSTITLGELLAWALRRQAPPRRLDDVKDFLKLVAVLDVTQDVSWKFGEVQAALLDAGIPAPDLDLLNGATALVHGLTIVTHNMRDYANVPGLQVVDWLAP